MRVLFLLLLLTSISQAQVKPLTVLKFDKAVEHAFVDRPGDLYIQFENGSIRKYDTNGKIIKETSPSEKVTVFEPRDGSRAFSYHRKGQWYSFALFGSFNKEIIPEEFAIEPWLVCSSGDKNLWIVDAADFSIKKINTNKGTIDVEVLLSQDLHKNKEDLIMIREYQNFLFIHNKNEGIEIHNAIGKRVKIIPGKDIEYFNFLGEELYFRQNKKLIFYDLYDTSVHEMEVADDVKVLLVTDERLFKVYTNKAEIFVQNP
ncbi:MAG TPA: hypothetical protein PLV21_14165 [Cyclobacteriaceae bacterium]|nr:hypothetical protein [Cyclobacteriaceae bacterium]HRJ83031.1 hypothetical protein [Cyclobacteriaceae bacterium]